MKFNLLTLILIFCLNFVMVPFTIAKEKPHPHDNLKPYVDCLGDYHTETGITSAKTFDDARLSCKTIRDELNGDAETKGYVPVIERKIKEMLNI